MDKQERESYEQNELELLRKRIKLFGASKMALLPGSYARAAGLQSEINKVTITRVAGSEVQFRRAIDTYQRDLRINVKQIWRDQEQLKKSMQRYSKKLQDNKKQKELQAQAKASSIVAIQAETEIEHSTKAKKLPCVEMPIAPRMAQVPKRTGSVRSSLHLRQQHRVLAPPDSPDSGLGGELDDKPSSLVPPRKAPAKESGTSKCRSRKSQKGFNIRQEAGVPLSKLKGNPKGGTYQSKEHQHDKEETGKEHSPGLSQEGEDVMSLPVIEEEQDESTAGGRIHSCKTSSPEKGHCITDNERCQASSTAAITVLLKVKDFPQTEKNKSSGPGHSEHHVEGEVSANFCDQDSTLKTLIPGDSSATRTRTRPRRRTEISYGDLIKLRHTSSTKRLFELVDRLAAKHGIADVPKRHLAVDPRANFRKKTRADRNNSQVLDGLLKQAAVLYSMKYGYQAVDDDPSDDSKEPSTMLPAESLGSVAENAGKEVLSKRHIVNKDHVNDKSDIMSQELPLVSAESDSINGTLRKTSISLLDDAVSGDFACSRDIRKPRVNLGRSQQRLSISELSTLSTNVRERNHLVPESQTSRLSISGSDKPISYTQVYADSPSLGKLPPLPRRSHWQSRSGRESVRSQLQKRLSEHKEDDSMAWHSVLARLKMLHTLYDLSRHFRKASI